MSAVLAVLARSSERLSFTDPRNPGATPSMGPNLIVPGLASRQPVASAPAANHTHRALVVNPVTGAGTTKLRMPQ